MPAILEQFAVKVLLPLMINWAIKHDMIGHVTGALAKFGLAVSELKTYHEPSDFPQSIPATLTPNNLQPSKVQ